MSEGLRSCVDRAVKLSKRLIVPENLLDYQIDDAAKQVILRMARGTETQCVVALGMVAAAKLGQLDEILGDDEDTLSRAFSDFRETFDSGVAIAAAAPNPWMCAFVCALCAAAILDGVPGDEVPLCALCMNLCSQSA